VTFTITNTLLMCKNKKNYLSCQSICYVFCITYRNSSNDCSVVSANVEYAATTVFVDFTVKKTCAQGMFYFYNCKLVFLFLLLFSLPKLLLISILLYSTLLYSCDSHSWSGGNTILVTSCL